ncbi:MAG: haloacid dehalogenase [Deltaproteobacteria bacterium]|nr:haloacid dehalogenase [Deltaproteobacteria bacterium]
MNFFKPPLPGDIPLDRLAFDIDGVVADIMTTFLDMAKERNGPHPYSYEHITTFRLEECLDLPSGLIDILIRELIDRPHELPVEPFPGAVPVLTRLAEESPLVFVTARDRAEPIQYWLRKTLALVPDRSIWVMATGDPDGKVHYLRTHAIDYFVEDRLETCFDLARAGITPILFAQPWNRRPHPFLEVRDWQDLARLLFESV